MNVFLKEQIMFAVYAEQFNIANPLLVLRTGEQPEPAIPTGWLRVKITHASLNRHDIFTLQGVTGHDEPTRYPMILGNDGVGILDNGSKVVIYPVMGSTEWRGDEMLDPGWHIFSEFMPGTFANYVAVPQRNLIPLPEQLSPIHGSVLGTAWLTAYRALFTKSGLKPGQTMLVQGASGGMATALIQMGRAAGFEVWATSRSSNARLLAEKLGAHKTFTSNEQLPRKVQAVFDNVGQASFTHSIQSTARGGTIVILGGTTGFDINLNLIPILMNEIKVVGAVMGTLQEMHNLIQFIVKHNIKPEIGLTLPMQKANEGFQAMLSGNIFGKIVFTN
jgi:NADPH:quinone reductase-like Zn-dependent oxidoreductase